MGSSAAEIGGDTQHTFAIHHRRVGWSKIMRHYDVRFGQRQERFWRDPEQVTNHPLSHVLDVERTLPQVRIVNLAQGVGVAGGDFLKHPLNIETVFV